MGRLEEAGGHSGRTELLCAQTHIYMCVFLIFKKNNEPLTARTTPFVLLAALLAAWPPRLCRCDPDPVAWPVLRPVLPVLRQPLLPSSASSDAPAAPSSSSWSLPTSARGVRRTVSPASSSSPWALADARRRKKHRRGQEKVPHQGKACLMRLAPSICYTSSSYYKRRQRSVCSICTHKGHGGRPAARAWSVKTHARARTLKGRRRVSASRKRWARRRPLCTCSEARARASRYL